MLFGYLQISVYDVLTVKSLESQENLRYIDFDIRLRKSPVTVEQMRQVAPLTELHEHVKVAVGLEGAIQLDDERVIERFHDVFFDIGVVEQLVLLEHPLGKHFEGKILAVGGSFGPDEVHLAERPLPENLVETELLDGKFFRGRIQEKSFPGFFVLLGLASLLLGFKRCFLKAVTPFVVLPGEQLVDVLLSVHSELVHGFDIEGLKDQADVLRFIHLDRCQILVVLDGAVGLATQEDHDGLRVVILAREVERRIEFEVLRVDVAVVLEEN